MAIFKKQTNYYMKSTLLYCIILILILPYCRAPQDLVFKDYKNLRLQNVSFSNANLAVDLIYYNPNTIGLELNRTDFDLYIDSSYLGHSSQILQVAIPARKEFTIPLTLQVDMKNLLKNGLTALTNKEVLVQLKGNVRVGKAGIYKVIKVDYASKQNFSMFK